MLGAFFMSVKCYGSTAVSKTASWGSTPCTDARGLAQSGSALALGARGRRFESCIPDQLGELAERSKAAVLKTVDVKASGGSNPSLSAIM